MRPSGRLDLSVYCRIRDLGKRMKGSPLGCRCQAGRADDGWPSSATGVSVTRYLYFLPTILHHTLNSMKPYIAVPAIAALVYRAWSRKSLTPIGIATALVVAIVHAIHPWSVFFALLATFFLAGTTVTKVIVHGSFGACN